MPAIVSFAKCGEYNFPAVIAAVKRIIDDLGGVSTIVGQGNTVLLKPNLLCARLPDEAVTTHPVVVKALIRIVKEAGGNPVVADSPSAGVDIETVWEKSGIGAVCREEKTELINLEKAGSKYFSIEGVSFSIATPVLEADAIINIPKFKTHVFTLLTNAVKNMYGTIPGFQKSRLHKEFPRPEPFGRFLGNLYKIVKPSLNICDAVVGMDGNGPSGGHAIRLGFLAGSTDGAALDAALCKLLKIKINNIHYLKVVHALGAGEIDIEKIRFTGEVPDSVLLPRIKLPNTWKYYLVPDMLVRMLSPFIWVYPVVTDSCNSCGSCVKVCPVSALSINDLHKPEVDKQKCIGCCCCNETCPQSAIEMQKSFLFKFFQ